MLFLIEYKQPEGRIVTFRRFQDSEPLKAQDVRLNLELGLKDHEVVLLEAAIEQALHSETHGRYFQTLRQIAESAAANHK